MFESNTFQDPFDYESVPESLINFASGIVATPQIENSLVSALEKGNKMAEKFVTERLVPNEKGTTSKSFYDTLSKPDIKPMSDMKKTVRIKKKNVQIEGEVMYLRLLAINGIKKVPPERVLAFENSPVPLSMFADDGSLLTTAKSVFMKKLEGMLPSPPLSTVTTSEAIIIDANAVIQILSVPKGTNEYTYQMMANQYTEYIISRAQNVCGDNLKQIHVVFD